MYKKYTPNDSKSVNYCKSVEGQNISKENIKPTKDSLSFIRQFARSYHVENKLPVALSGMALN